MRIIFGVLCVLSLTTSATAQDDIDLTKAVFHGENMGGVLRQIEDSILVVSDMMKQIANATETQSAAGEHLWQNINSVATISPNTAANIELARDEMMTLADSSKALYETVGQFKLAKTAA